MNVTVTLTDDESKRLLDVATYELVARDRAEIASMTNCEGAVWRRIAEKLAEARAGKDNT